MAKIPDLIPVTDFRQGAAEILKRVQDSDQPVILTQRGRAAAVMLSIEAYEKAENERELLQLLAQGEKEIRAGSGHELDEVLSEADSLLSDDQ